MARRGKARIKFKMKITVDIPEKLNKELKMHKVRQDFINLQEALVDVLKKFFKNKKE